MKTEKLTLEHLAPYLPHGLQFISSMDKPFDEFGNNPVWTFDGINKMFGGYCITVAEDNDAYAIQTCKPILRPLSGLTKEITVNGETFVPIANIHKADPDGYFGHSELDDMQYIITGGIVDIMPYCFVIKLLEWHFDVFKLIEKGLAIDINTITK